jgi:hypothetical protein
MATSKLFFAIVVAILSCALAACAPTPTATLAPTATPAPTATGTPFPSTTPTLTPQPSATATIAPTTTRTLSPLEARATTLRALPGFAWQAQGDAITLADAKGMSVATLDEKAGGVLRVTTDAASAFAQMKEEDKTKLLEDNAAYIRAIQTPFFLEAKTGEPQAERVSFLVKDKLTNITVPRYAAVTWDAQSNRYVVEYRGKISSYIDAVGNKDVSPSFPKILVETQDDEKRVRQALTDIAPYVLDLPNFVDNFYSYYRAQEFKTLIETYYPGVNFDELLAGIKKTSVEYQERSMQILAIGTPALTNASHPGATKNVNNQNTRYAWKGALAISPILISTKNICNPAQLYGGLLKEYFSMAATETMSNSPQLYTWRAKESPINHKSYSINFCERFGAYAFIQDRSALPQISMEFISLLFNYSFKPDSELQIN